MKTQKTPNSQSNLEREEQNYRCHTPILESIPHSYRIQNSMVLAQKQKYRSMEQDKKPRDKSTLIQSINL